MNYYSPCGSHVAIILWIILKISLRVSKDEDSHPWNRHKACINANILMRQINGFTFILHKFQERTNLTKTVSPMQVFIITKYQISQYLIKPLSRETFRILEKVALINRVPWPIIAHLRLSVQLHANENSPKTSWLHVFSRCATRFIKRHLGLFVSNIAQHFKLLFG